MRGGDEIGAGVADVRAALEEQARRDGLVGPNDVLTDLVAVSCWQNMSERGETFYVLTTDPQAMPVHVIDGLCRRGIHVSHELYEDEDDDE